MRWRQDGGWQPDSLARARAAQRFRRDVEHAGSGRGLLGPVSRYLEQVAAPAVTRWPFLQVAEHPLNTRVVSVSHYQVGRYRSTGARFAETFRARRPRKRRLGNFIN